MKKVLLLLLCVLLLLSLYGCNEVSPANSIEPPSNIYVGMSRADFEALYPEDICYYYWGTYAFFDDPDGNPVVVYFAHDEAYNATVASIDAYDKNGISTSEDAFCQLRGGMTVQEIVSYVGNPDRYMSSGETMRWRVGDATGDGYYIQCIYENGHQTDKLRLQLLIRWEGDEYSFPIGSEPWYPPE